MHCPSAALSCRTMHAISVRVLDEIPYTAFAAKSIEELTREVRDRIAAELAEPAAS